MSQNTVTNPVKQILPFPPRQYDAQYMDRVIQLLRQFMNDMYRVGSNPTYINVFGMPTNANQLPPGTVYIDADILRVVILLGLYPPAFQVEAEMHDVDWSIT